MFGEDGGSPVVKVAVFEIMLSPLALILQLPALVAVNSPDPLIDPMPALLVGQVSVAKFAGVAVVPSVMLPLAVSCCVLPTATLADVGVMEMDENAGELTVKVAPLEVTPFAEAVTVVTP